MDADPIARLALTGLVFIYWGIIITIFVVVVITTMQDEYRENKKRELKQFPILQKLPCECGTLVWIVEDRKSPPCPKCNKRYWGEFNPKTKTLIKKEILNE